MPRPSNDFVTDLYQMIVQVMCSISGLDAAESAELVKLLQYDIHQSNYSGSCDDGMLYNHIAQFVERHGQGAPVSNEEYMAIERRTRNA